MDDFDQRLIGVIGNEHSKTLEEAIELTKLSLSESEEAVMERILRLESQGEISFKRPPTTASSSLYQYVFSRDAEWFWGVFGLAILASFSVYAIPENTFPFVYARYLFGSSFVLFLPGYSLTRFLFRRKELDSVERFVLSMGSSLALVPIVGLLLNYTPWGIRTMPVTFCLFALTLVFASVTIVQEYLALRKMAGV